MHRSEQPSPNVHVFWVAPERGYATDPRGPLARRGVSVTHLSSARAALQVFDSPNLSAPHCVLVDPSVAGLHTLLIALRAQPNLSHIPVVYVTPRIGQGVLEEAQAVGADDVYWTGDEGYLGQLVDQLRHYHPEQRPALNGRVAFILHSRQERRRMLGRVYRNAGFQVVFGSSEQDLLQYAHGGSPLDIVVACRGLLGGGRSEVRRVRGRVERPALPFILLDEEEHDTVLPGSHGTDLVASMGEDGPTENVLFLTNELMAGDRASARGSRRLLFNGLCSFRATDHITYRFASLYNISRTGLYVRTLVPMEKGQSVHLELTPPGAPCLHVSGVVAWSRGVAGNGQLSPPGFGLQLLPSQCAPTELEAYVEAYEALAADHGRRANRPSSSGVRQPGIESLLPQSA